MARAETMRGTRRSTMIRRGEEGFGARAMVWLKRLGIVCLALCFVMLCGVIYVLGDSVVQKRLSQKFDTITARMGYKIENVLVEGRTYTRPDQVMGMISVEKGDPIFRVDLDTVKAEIEALPWVKHAHVERRLPDTLYVNLEERTPFALWQKEKDLVLIDPEGVVIADKNLKSFKHLIMVSGKEAGVAVADLVQMLAAEPELKSRLDHANRIESRRWDLVLKDGKVIKLPEKDMGLAMRNLVKQHQEEGLLDKPLTTLDVRDPARLIVRTDVGKAQDLAVNEHTSGQSL